jgi:phage terminase small subunit
MALTDKQIAFCETYTLDFNKKAAAIRAGYSAKSADSIGARLLDNPEVAEYMGKIKAEQAAKLNITRDRVAREYAKIAFGDIRKAFNPDGSIKKIQDLDDDTAAMITGFEITQKGYGPLSMERCTKVKLSEKRAALDSLCRMLGYNEPEKVEVEEIKKKVVYR